MWFLKVLQEADLGLLLHRLVRRAVLAHAEGVVRPDEFNGEAHQCREAHRRLHVIAKGEEGAACGYDAAVHGHAVAQGGHRQLAYADLQERAAEVALHKLLGLLEEAVGLVAVGEVGGGDDHVLHSLGQPAQNGARGVAAGAIGLVGDVLEVQGRQLAGEELIELGGQGGVGVRPLLLLGFAGLGFPGLLLPGLAV